MKLRRRRDRILSLLDLEETDTSQEITHVSVNTGLSVDDVMRLVVSARVAAEIATPPGRHGGGLRLGPPEHAAGAAERPPPQHAEMGR